MAFGKAASITPVLPNLGLVCITASDRVRYRTITRTRLLQFDLHQQQAMLRDLYRDNIARFNVALDFCDEWNIRLYRLTSRLLPFADDPVGQAILPEFQVALAETGERATSQGIRVVVHPDQFVVLNSDSPDVVANSIKILDMHAHILDLLRQPRSTWAALEIHGGKGGREARLVETIRELPDGVHSRLALENDERAYGASEILDVCRAAGVPMVFDAHHHIVHEGLVGYDDPSIAEMLALARETWQPPEWQLVHISNGRGAPADPAHSDLIAVMPDAYRAAPWIEVEAKHKELAIARLRDEWLHAAPESPVPDRRT
ncbi:MAG: UV DNA damage repair endonuclease UvsE [Anaerolineae bacterium]